MVMTINDGVPGIGDPGRLIGWLAANGVRGAARLRGIELIAGGRSNLTYRLDFGAGPADGHGLDAAGGHGLDAAAVTDWTVTSPCHVAVRALRTTASIRAGWSCGARRSGMCSRPPTT